MFKQAERVSINIMDLVILYNSAIRNDLFVYP